jgi:membrane-associated phospholipid phosphatase
MSHTNLFDKFFLSITVLGEIWLPTLICAITYWCIDFRAGIYLFSMETFGSIISHFLKMIACVYRPWVLSDKIHPSELAVPYAKGYSCPSGHSAMSSSVLGGLAYLVRRKKALCIFLICLVLLIGFSRMWLGVHTPQDVVFGLLIGLSLIFIVDRIVNWAEEKPDRYLFLVLVINTLTLLALIYIKYFNNYRMDYVNGELLVNPQKTIYVTEIVCTYALGLINGCFLCRRFFPFNPKDFSIKNRFIKGFIGGISLILIIKFAVQFVFMNKLPLIFGMPCVFISGLFITLLYPIIFQCFDKCLSRKN